MAEGQTGTIFDQCAFAVLPSRDLDVQYALKARHALFLRVHLYHSN